MQWYFDQVIWLFKKSMFDKTESFEIAIYYNTWNKTFCYVKRINHYQLWNMHMFQYFMISILRPYWIPVYMRFSLHFLLPFLHWNISNLAPNSYLFLRKQVNFQRNVISHYLHIWRKYNSKSIEHQNNVQVKR